MKLEYKMKIQNMKRGHKMKLLLIISIFIASLFANDLKNEENTFAIKEKKVDETNHFNDYKKIPKINNNSFPNDSIEVKGSITIEHTF